MRSITSKRIPVHNKTHRPGHRLLVPVLWAMLTLPMALTAGQDPGLVVYKSPTCGCCKGWVEHMRANGYQVEVRDRQSVLPVKESMGIPRDLRSCHTAVVDGYVIEGHVPADAVARLLKERPAVRGLAVPGMVMGTPGMEGPRSDPYDIVSFGDDGSAAVYESRR